MLFQCKLAISRDWHRATSPRKANWQHMSLVLGWGSTGWVAGSRQCQGGPEASRASTSLTAPTPGHGAEGPRTASCLLLQGSRVPSRAGQGSGALGPPLHSMEGNKGKVRILHKLNQLGRAGARTQIFLLPNLRHFSETRGSQT